MTPWSRVTSSIGVIGGLLGIFGTLFGIWAFFETRESKLINFNRRTDTVFRAPRYFQDEGLLKGGVPWISESTIVIWNAGSVSFRESDVRVPITLDLGRTDTMINARIIEARSSVENNFRIDNKSSSPEGSKRLTIRFAIFDPGMALKIALLHEGTGGAISIGGDLGPGVEIREYSSRARDVAQYFAWALLVLIYLVGGVALFVFIESRKHWNDLLPWTQTVWRFAGWSLMLCVTLLIWSRVENLVFKFVSVGPPLSVF